MNLFFWSTLGYILEYLALSMALAWWGYSGTDRLMMHRFPFLCTIARSKRIAICVFLLRGVRLEAGEGCALVPPATFQQVSFYGNEGMIGKRIPKTPRASTHAVFGFYFLLYFT